MSRAHAIGAVGVVIPARDEQDRIGACLAAVEDALRALPAGLATAVWVVVDRSRDATAEIVGRRFAGRDDRGYSLNRRTTTIGAVRHQGTERLLRLFPGHAPRHIWLLHTDADTRVPPDWALAQIRYARGHAHAVAGTAELDAADHLTPLARRRYERLLARRPRPVYGANLGVRADTYAEVGGFAAHPAGEDHDLVRRLARAGYTIVHATDVTVTTSGRLAGRAAGGLADLLAELSRTVSAR